MGLQRQKRKTNGETLGRASVASTSWLTSGSRKTEIPLKKYQHRIRINYVSPDRIVRCLLSRRPFSTLKREET